VVNWRASRRFYCAYSRVCFWLSNSAVRSRVDTLWLGWAALVKATSKRSTVDDCCNNFVTVIIRTQEREKSAKHGFWREIQYETPDEPSPKV
jgi:hypothetical protein